MDLGDEGRLGLAAEVAVQLVGTEPDAEAHPDASAMPRQLGQFGHGGVRMRLAPAAPQKGIRLRRIVEPREAELAQPGHHVLAVLVLPRPAEVALDDAEFGNHACGRHGSQDRRETLQSSFMRDSDSDCPAITS